MTADTRWSAGVQGDFVLSDGKAYFVYCDDTGFDKITVVNKTALITAGHGPLIAEWKQWWSGDADPKKRPQTEINGQNVVNLAILDLEQNCAIFDAGLKQILYCSSTNAVKAFASGSGAIHAASHLQVYGCAKTAVEYASELDYCTGSMVSFACYKTDKNNLNHGVNDYQAIVQGITQRGKIMDLKLCRPNGEGIEISKHPLKDEITSLFATGQAVASAPVPGIGSFKWTNETESKFEEAMKRVHQIRNS